MPCVMDALLDVDTITDPDVTVSLKSGRIDVAMYLRAHTNEEAMSVAKDALAQAIHNSGGLADWEEYAEDVLRDEQYEAHVRRADLTIA